MMLKYWLLSIFNNEFVNSTVNSCFSSQFSRFSRVRADIKIKITTYLCVQNKKKIEKMNKKKH